MSLGPGVCKPLFTIAMLLLYTFIWTVGKQSKVNDTKYFLTVLELSSMVLTKLHDSRVHGLTVSVRPSRNNLVILDSYVKQNFPASYSNRRDKGDNFPYYSLTLLHLERPKFCGILAVLSAIGLKCMM